MWWPSIILPNYWGSDQLYFQDGVGGDLPLFLRPKQDYYMGPCFCTTVTAFPVCSEDRAMIVQVHSNSAPNQFFQLLQFLPFNQGQILGSSPFPMTISLGSVTYETENYNV